MRSEPSAGEPSGPPGARRRRSGVRLARAFAWVLIGLAGLLTALLVIGLVLLQTDRGRDRVRLFALGRLRAMVQGRVEVARLGGDFLHSVELEGLSISGPAGEPLMAVERFRVDYDVGGFLRREVLLGDVDLVEPSINLVQDSVGEWNYLKILPFLRPREEPDPKVPGGWGSVVRLGTLNIVNGRLSAVTEAPGQTFATRSHRVDVSRLNGRVELEIAARAGEDRKRFATEDLSFLLAEPRLSVRELDARAIVTPEGVDLERFLLRTAATELSGAGTVRDPAAPVLDLTFRADPLALEEVRGFAPAVPFDGTVSGSVKLAGPADSLDLTLREFVLRTSRSRVEVDGKVTTGGSPVMEGQLVLAPLDPADGRAAWPRYPVREPLQARLSARGSRERMAVEGEVAFGATTGALSGTVGYSGKDPVYDLQAAVQRLDLEDLLHEASWRSLVNAELRLSGKGREAAVEGSIRDSRVRGHHLVAGSLRGRASADAFRLDALHLELPRSAVRAAGVVPFSRPVNVEFSAVSRDLRDLYPAGGPMPAARFEAQGRVAGPLSGLDVGVELAADSLATKGVVLDTLAASAALTDVGGPGFRMALDAWGAGIRAPGGTAVDSLNLRAGMAGDTVGVTLALEVDSLRSAEAHTAIRMGGGAPRIVLDHAVFTRGTQVWRLREPGLLTFQDGEVRFDDFVLAENGQRVRLDGTLSLSGRQDVRFALENLALEELQALAGVPPRATGVLDASGSIRGTARVPVIESRLSMVRARAGGLAVERLAGRIDYAARRLGVKMEVTPDSITRGDGEGAGSLVIRGHFPVDLGFQGVARRFPDEAIDLAVESRALDLAALRPRSATGSQETGRLQLDLRLAGRPSAPLLEGRFSVGESRVGGLAVSRLSGEIGYAERELRLNAELVPKATPAASGPEGQPTLSAGEGDAGSVLLRGTFPVDLTVGPVARRVPDRPIDLRLSSRDMSLALLQALSPLITEASGPLNLAVHLTGTPTSPRYDGEITVRDGAFRIGAEGARYSGLNGAVRFDNDRISLDEMRIASPGGEARLTGGIALQDLTLGEIDARLAARRFTLLDEDGKELIVDADIGVTGTTRQPEIAGTLNVEQMEWPLPERSDKDVINVDEAIMYVRATGDTVPADPAAPDAWRETRLDVDVTIEDDAILKNEKALIVLEGDLSIDKPRGADRPALAGSVQVVRGYYADFGKRFEVAQGEVQFYGTPDLDPGLNVVAVTSVDNSDTGEEVEVTLTLGGSVREPTLDVASNPPYEKSEIFSLLLFGTTTPGQGEETRFQDTMARVATGQATGALASELGLDILEIQPGVGAEGGTGIRAGKYVAPDVFVTYTQASGPLQESQFGVQYRLSRKLTLETRAGSRQFGADILYQFQY